MGPLAPYCEITRSQNTLNIKTTKNNEKLNIKLYTKIALLKGN